MQKLSKIEENQRRNEKLDSELRIRGLIHFSQQYSPKPKITDESPF